MQAHLMLKLVVHAANDSSACRKTGFLTRKTFTEIASSTWHWFSTCYVRIAALQSCNGHNLSQLCTKNLLFVQLSAGPVWVCVGRLWMLYIPADIRGRWPSLARRSISNWARSQLNLSGGQLLRENKFSILTALHSVNSQSGHLNLKILTKGPQYFWSLEQ